ncbi:MAG: hypothetical protein ACI8W8_003608, partial [Rhodothermales bacterium]
MIFRDANRLAYDGLDPIIDTAQTVDRTLQLTTGADSDARLEALDADTLLLSGSTFENVTFELPSSSLTILGLAGQDHLTIGSLSLANTSLRVESESITLEAGATLSGNAEITLIAADDESAVTVVDRAASITVAGTISTTANLTLEATASRIFSTVIDSPAAVFTISTATQIHLTADAS